MNQIFGLKKLTLGFAFEHRVIEQIKNQVQLSILAKNKTD